MNSKVLIISFAGFLILFVAIWWFVLDGQSFFDRQANATDQTLMSFPGNPDSIQVAAWRAFMTDHLDELAFKADSIAVQHSLAKDMNRDGRPDGFLSWVAYRKSGKSEGETAKFISLTVTGDTTGYVTLDLLPTQRFKSISPDMIVLEEEQEDQRMVNRLVYYRESRLVIGR